MPSRHAGKAILKGDLQRMRGLLMLQRKLTSGLSNDLLAKEFNTSRSTIERTLRWVKNTGLINHFEDQILEKLVPQAMSAIEHALKENNAQVALEIFKGTGILKKPREAASPVQEQNDSDDLELYIQRKQELAQLSVKEAPQLGPAIIDGVTNESLLEMPAEEIVS